MFEKAETLWVVHIGHNDKIALRALKENFIAIGWDEMGDMSGLKTRNEFRKAYKKAFPDATPGQLRTYGQPYRFVHEMKIGDPVVYPIKPTREIAIGKIIGEYEYKTDDEELRLQYPNYRKVEWIRTVPRTAFSQAALYSFGAFSTVSTSDDYLEEVVNLIKHKKDIEEKEIEEQIDEAGEEEENLFDTAVLQTEDYLLKQWIRTGHEFEHVVAAVLEAIGYTTKVTQASGDHGIDIIAHPDRLGLKRPYVKVQVKSGISSISGPVVSQLKGSLQTGEQGMVVSLGNFTKDALSIARNTSDLVLIDGQEFVRLFLDYYDRLDARWQSRFPLKRVYVPTK